MSPPPESGFDLRGLVWADPDSRCLLSMACRVARTDLPVLIAGPSGSGKDRVADLIRANSLVADGPFVVLDCGALAAESIDAELFGVAGLPPRKGKFEAADGGTIFLDEIGNLSAAAQAKLLRVVDSGRFTPLGAQEERQVRVRVISATNMDMRAMVAAGAFRADLYYRLEGVALQVPALSARRADILALAWAFLAPGKTLHPAAQKALRGYDWPGNVRQLKNVIARASLFSCGAIVELDDLALPVTTATFSKV